MFSKTSLYVFLFLVFLSNLIFSQNQIPFSVIASGGGKTSNQNFILTGTLGETLIGKSTNSLNNGYSGFWYIYHQGTITSADEDGIMPRVFKLEQNYPNPFNPSTVIKYAVPQRSLVQIKIYTILGEELIELVNEEKEQGWYEVDLNLISAASGVYLYRMNAGDYVSTKKMILIK